MDDSLYPEFVLIAVSPGVYEVQPQWDPSRLERFLTALVPIVFVSGATAALILVLVMQAGYWWLAAMSWLWLQTVAIFVFSTKTFVDANLRAFARHYVLFGRLRVWQRWRVVHDEDELGIFVNWYDAKHKNRTVHRIGVVRGHTRFVVVRPWSCSREPKERLIELAEEIGRLLSIRSLGYVEGTRFFWW